MWVVPKSSVNYTIKMFGVTFECRKFATGLHPSSAYVERETFHYALVPVVLSVTLLLQTTTLTLAGREGEALSLITV